LPGAGHRPHRNPRLKGLNRTLLLAVLGVATTTPAAAKRPPLPPYPYALRCAALTEAAAKLAEGSSEEPLRFDQALFWGLAASEAARKAKLSGKRFTQDQLDTGRAALAELKAGNAAATFGLEACRRQVPPR
jgi:hypothetical protein